MHKNYFTSSTPSIMCNGWLCRYNPINDFFHWCKRRFRYLNERPQRSRNKNKTKQINVTVPCNHVHVSHWNKKKKKTSKNVFSCFISFSSFRTKFSCCKLKPEPMNDAWLDQKCYQTKWLRRKKKNTENNLMWKGKHETEKNTKREKKKR